MVIRGRTRRAGLPAAWMLLTASLTGCVANGGSVSDGPSVVASFYPLAYVAARVGGPDLQVSNLTQAGGEPHDLELGFSQILDLQKAEVVVFESGLQPAVDDAVADLSGERLVDAARVVTLRPSVEDPEEPDPHFWLDPLLLADVGESVADALARADTAHADEYAARAHSLRADLERLDRDFTRDLSGCARSTVVVSHDAFGYLARYGLHFEAIAGITPDAEPTPAGLAALQELARREGITTVFSERLASPALADTLAADLGIRTAVLDPIEGLSDETQGEDYVSLMRANLAALRKANDC